jgi:hypothetical protein
MKNIAPLLAASALFILGGCATPTPSKLEYQTVRTIKGVNERAAKGWTVVNVIVKPNGSHEYLMERSIK